MIDILMAVYNNADHILPLLESLMGQTYSHFRLIIRDDCSTDDSVKIIEGFSQNYPDKILLIKGQKNLGAQGNFAELLHEARSPYIMFCDADDIWLPTKIEESLTLMQKNERIYGEKTPLLIHTDLTVVDNKLFPLNHSFWNYSQLKPHTANSLNRLLVQNVITGCTMLINKPLLELAAPIPAQAIMHDWWIALVASVFGQIDFLAKSTVLYRQHGKNAIGAKNWNCLATYWTSVKKIFFSDGRQEFRLRLLRTMEQASQFLICYGDFLPLEKKHVVKNYSTLSLKPALKKLYLFFKHGYFKHTLAKNMGMLFFLVSF